MLKKVRAIIQLSIPLAKVGFLLRNEGSYLGILWYLLNPLLLFGLLVTIFSRSLGNSIEHYPLYLLLGIILFNFFHITTNEATRIIHNNDHTIKSIHFPLESLLGGIIVMTIVSHICEILLFLIFCLVYKVSLLGILFYPLLLFFFALFCFGAALLLAALTIHFVDLENVWAFFLRLLWFGTPIFYAVDTGSRLFLLNMCNPLYYFIRAARDMVLYHSLPPLWVIGGIVGFTFLSLLLGVLVFKKLKPTFAELI